MFFGLLLIMEICDSPINGIHKLCVCLRRSDQCTLVYTSYVFVCVGQINENWYTQVMCLFVTVRSMHTGIHKLCVCLCRSDQCTLVYTSYVFVCVGQINAHCALVYTSYVFVCDGQYNCFTQVFWRYDALDAGV